MSITDFTRRIGRASRGAVESASEKIVEATAAVVDLLIERNWRMEVSKIDEKIVEARAALAAAETAHGEAACDFELGMIDDDKTVERRRKELVAAREKVEDLMAARVRALQNAKDADSDATAKAEAVWIEALENAMYDLRPKAQRVEECLDALAVALEDLWHGANAVSGLGKRARPAHVAVLDVMGHLPTLVYHKLGRGRLGVVPNGANLMSYASEAGLVRRLPDPSTMANACPPVAPVAPGKKSGGTYYVP